MSRRANLASVGLFVCVIIAMTIGFLLYVGDRSFSGKEQQRYELLYDSSVKGLNIGAPVTLRGVKIGEVVSIRTKLYGEQNQLLNSVVIAIYLDSIVIKDKPKNSEALVDVLLKNGLAARLGLQSVLTGLLYVEVDMFNSEATPEQFKTEYPQIPTIQNNLEAILQQLEEVDYSAIASNLAITMENLARISSSDEMMELIVVARNAFERMEYMAGSTSESMAGMRDEFENIANNMAEMKQLLSDQLPPTTAQLNATMVELQRSMQQLQSTMVVVEDSIASDSPLLYQLQQSSRDFGRTSRAIEQLADMLEQQPSSLFFGRKEVSQ